MASFTLHFPDCCKAHATEKLDCLCKQMHKFVSKSHYMEKQYFIAKSKKKKRIRKQRKITPKCIVVTAY